jgi:hypothetical protein
MDTAAKPPRTARKPTDSSPAFTVSARAVCWAAAACCFVGAAINGFLNPLVVNWSVGGLAVLGCLFLLAGLSFSLRRKS